MKVFYILSLLVASLISCSAVKKYDPQDGDIIFQHSQSAQCEAIKIATGSEYTHVGIIFNQGGKAYVLEAVQPVKATPLKEWIKRGKNEHYVVKRLKDKSVLSADALKRMYTIGKGFKGKNYDAQFGWSDGEIYCSELVWKIYDRGAGIKVGQKRKMKEYNFKHPLVREKIKERYGSALPLEETVVAPSDIYDAETLITVFRG